MYLLDYAFYMYWKQFEMLWLCLSLALMATYRSIAIEDSGNW
jgi:hypothetical protein